MRIAARWFGWGSLTAALAATAVLTAHPVIVTEHGDNVFYEVSVSGLDAELADDGQIRGLTFNETDTADRTECLRRAVCQYRFNPDMALPFVTILVAGPSARLKIAPVLKHPYD